MRRLTVLCALTLLMTTTAFAQTAPTPFAPQVVQPQQGTAPPAPTQTPRAPYLGSTAQFPPAAPTTNVRLELSITDTFTGTPISKTVSMVVLTGNSGMIRTTNTGERFPAILNVDANVAAYQDGSVAVRMTFEYVPATIPGETPNATRMSPPLNESITVLLQDGKSMVVSQSADPATDRKVTTELKATILK